MTHRKWPIVAAMLCCFATVLFVSAPVLAKRADVIRLLPQNTYVYVSVANAPELADKFMETGFGQMLQDDQLAPVLGQLFDELENLASPVTDEIGLTLTDLTMIPQGELTFAILEQGPNMDPGVVLFADVHEQMLAVQQMLDRADEEFARGDRSKTVEEVDGTELIYYDMPGDSDFVYFEKEGTLVISNSLPASREFLATWSTGRSNGFHTNRAFATVVDRSRGPRGEKPQITWFVDPIAFIKRANNDDFIMNNIMDRLGLNGLKCVGGSVMFATEDYDAVSHFHIIMDHPRPGMLNVLAFEPGEMIPEPWIPADVSTYMAMNFNFQDAFDTTAEMVNPLLGDDGLEQQAENAFRQLNVEFQDEILAALDNRVAYSAWIQEPVTIMSQGQVIGFKLKDGNAFKPTFDKIIEVIKRNANIEERPFAGKTYYAFEFGLQQPDPEENPFGAQPPSPCFMILNDYLLISDRTFALEEAIRASRGDVATLESDPDFQLVMETAKRLAGGEPALIGFSRPEVGLGYLYNLATGDAAREGLRTVAEQEEQFSGLSRLLEENTLPPFEDLAGYLAPTGGILTSDETGLHYTSLGLKTKAREEAQEDGNR